MNKYLDIVLIAFLLLALTSGAQDEFEHKEFTNPEGVYINYDINKMGDVQNGKLANGNLILTFEGNTGQVMYYRTDQGSEGVIHVKPYDGTVFDVDLLEKNSSEAWASYRFEGNFYSQNSPNQPYFGTMG